MEEKDQVPSSRDAAEIPSNMTFEAALARLEVIVGALDAGSAPLDDSLKMFEEGVALVRLCNERLDHAEQRMKILMKQEDGSYDERDFQSTSK